MSAAGPAMAPSRFSRHRRRTLVGALVAAASLVAVACGDDAKKEAGPAESQFVDYCDASFNLETYFAEDPDIDFDSASPEEISAAVKTYLQGAKPLVDKVIPLVPAEIKKATDTLLAGFNQALAGGDAEQIFESPEAKAAEAQTHSFDLKNCGWAEVKVSTVDYDFKGLPKELPAGKTSFDLTNKGKELHEIVLLSKNAGVTESFDDLLALPEEEARTKVTGTSLAFAPPGEDDYGVVDLAKGEYVAVCFIPEGLTSEEAEPSPDAKPHFLLGMKQEITVT